MQPMPCLDMKCHMVSFMALILLVLRFRVHGFGEDVSYDTNYVATWGIDHFLSLNQGKEVQLSLDQSSGTGFGSKSNYGSGFFSMRIKLPGNNTAGVVTAFYLASDGNNHDEVDFEFLGNKEGKPVTLQTNVFINGDGNREQRTLLWFDPAADFHTYKILWNNYQIVFFVDDTPIRVLKNAVFWGIFPSKPMRIYVSLWNGDSWATDGGQTKIDWNQAPFQAHFRGFGVDGCAMNQSPSATEPCNSYKYWWNGETYWNLNSIQQEAYKNVRRHFLNYDYCLDTSRHIQHPECFLK